eukprot:364650-Chlamydomonas_euryale.AAC.6
MDVLASACQCVLVLTWITGSDEERFPDPCDDQTTYLLLILSHLSAERAGQAGMKREVVSNVRLRGIAGVQLPVWRFFAWSYVCAILNVHALCIMHAHRVCIQSVATCIPGQLAVTKNVSLIPVMIKRRHCICISTSVSHLCVLAGYLTCHVPPNWCGGAVLACRYPFRRAGVEHVLQPTPCRRVGATFDRVQLAYPERPPSRLCYPPCVCHAVCAPNPQAQLRLHGPVQTQAHVVCGDQPRVGLGRPAHADGAGHHPTRP